MSKLIEYAVIALIGAAALWWFNDSIRDYYQKPLIESYAEAQRLARKQSETRATENEKRKLGAENAKIKQLEINLAAANAANASANSLRDSLRTGRNASQANLSSCAQYADTVTNILATGAELARRIAAEADGHVSDKIACSTAWPK
jgi:hypothetical protein